MNFLSETIAAIELSGKRTINVVFIGSEDGKLGCTWDEFERLANFTYDNGFGSAQIGEDLVIRFDDRTWLERGEYDGSEWWEHKGAPQIPISYETIRSLQGPGMWPSVAEINRGADL